MIHRSSTAQLKASDPLASAWVNANAGSGKTHVLVDRVIRLMLAGTAPSRILCLTFTKAAAAEMSSRLYERLGTWVTLPPDELAQHLQSIGVRNPEAELLKRARQLFTLALETPGGLKIQTIHAFCERLLQHFPVEAGIIPQFRVMDDQTAAETLRAARLSVLARAGHDDETGQALAEITRHVQASGFDDLVKSVLSERANLETYLGNASGVDTAMSELCAKLGLSGDAGAVMAGLSPDVPTYRRFYTALRIGTDRDRDRADLIASVMSESAPNLLMLRIFFLTKEDAARKIPGIATKAVTRAHPWVEDFIAAEQQRLLAALGKLADLEHVAATRALLVLASEIIREYEQEKRRRGAYDFDDLIIRAGHLLGERPDAAWVLYKLDGGIEHVLLDEAQDTSPAQWQIIRALTEEFFAGQGKRQTPDRTLFAVGDRKQSIYSFQGADPDIFEIVHDDFEDRIRASGQDFNDVDFTVSFRSTAEILTAVDTVFGPAQVARAGVEERRDIVHQTNRLNDHGLVEIWPLLEPEDREDHEPWTAPVDREPANSPRRKLARMIARKVKSWIGARQIGNSGRIVQPGDILILVRVRNAFFDALISEMRRENVPVAGADRLKLVENIAVLDLLALARVCLLQEDDYSLACVLKSPILAEPFTEAQLFDAAWNRGPRALWERLPAQLTEALSHWQKAARRLAPYEFFAGVLRDSRLRFLSRLGSEAGDALDAFLQAALDYERDHNASLQGFVHWFVSGDIEIKRNMEQGANEVRIMTVHGAKGLEAPIVILPDTASIPEGRGQASLLMVETGKAGIKLPLWKLPARFESEALAGLKGELAQDRAHEYRRLLYVAMTRARDELYVCGYQGARKLPEDCWYNLVSGALLPIMAECGDGWRLGAAPVYGVAEPSTRSPKTTVPDWARRAPHAEPRASRWSEPSRLASFEEAAPKRLERGLLIHRILQLMPDVASDIRPALVGKMVVKAGHEESLGDEILALIQHPELAMLFTADGLSEVPIMADLKAHGLKLSGRIDRLILGKSEITAIDYKTDRNWPDSPDAVKPDYLLQMAAYAAALKAIHPGMTVRCAILWTAAPKLMPIPDMLLEQALLTRRDMAPT